MSDWNAMANEDFARLVHDFADRHCPQHLRFMKRRVRWHEVRELFLTLSREGMLAPGWPTQYGGMGLSPAKHLLYVEQMELLGVPRLPDIGLNSLGPLLIKHGNEDQRDRFLAPILAGEHIWCQGYSEPGSGSDLASLSTKAVLKGDNYIVNGQKIWTSWAPDATHMFALVRTDPDAKKQEGISFLLIDLKQPGVKMRSIVNLLGDEDFCQVFLDDVVAPKANLVGEINKGWHIAKTLLGFERIWLGSPRQSRYFLNRLKKLLELSGLSNDPLARDQLVQFEFDVADLEAAYEGFADRVRAGQPLGADVSFLKIWASETCRRMAGALIELAGAAGERAGDISVGGEQVDVVSAFLESHAFTIYGGSSEIQRNIMAKNVLALPA